MIPSISAVFIVLSLLTSNINAKLSSCPQPAIDYTPPNVLPGYSITKVAGNLTHPRQIISDNQHNLLVSSLGQGILGFVPTFDDDNCPTVTGPKVIVPDNGMNFSHSLVLSREQTKLYASTPDLVLGWDYDVDGNKVCSEEKVVVYGMVLPGSISITRAMAIPREYPNILLVFRGEYSDFTYESADVSSGLYVNT